MEGSSGKTCARCNETINCLANDVDSCECKKVILTNIEREFIDLLFKNCLCNACLIELQNELKKITI